MKKKSLFFLIPSFLLANVCLAQTPEMKAAPGNVNIDGKSTEWSNDMFVVNKKKGVDYIISRDNENIYLVLKTTDPVRIGSILGAGTTWTINTKGSKNTEYALIFPAFEKEDKEDKEQYLNMVPEQITAKAALANYKNLTLKGFKDIKDNTVSPTNPYGIKVAINYDEVMGLVYEASIPLGLLTKNNTMGAGEWAFNIKVNGLQKTKIPGAMIVSRTHVNVPGQQLGALPPPENMQLTDPVDFWTKYVFK